MKMVQLIEFRKEKLINFRNVFKDDTEVDNHIEFIRKEIFKSDKENRMIEIKNFHKFKCKLIER